MATCSTTPAGKSSRRARHWSASGSPTLSRPSKAVTAWRDLRRALHHHGKQLFGSDVKITGIRASRCADARDVAAVRLIDELATPGRRSGVDVPPSASPAAEAWTAAACSVRAASDLLATHRDLDGAWRSPHAQVLDDPAARLTGFGDLAALVVPVAGAADQLGLRAGQAGIWWRDVERLVPQTRILLDVALEVRAVAGTPGGDSLLRSMEVASPVVRTDDPVIELGDRLARLHRMAWQLTREQRVGVGTLADFAAVGVFVNEHANRLLCHWARSEADSERPPTLLRQVGAAWRVAHMHCRQLRTATPPLRGVRGDAFAVRALLERVIKRAAEEQPHPSSRRYESVIFGGVRAFSDVAKWNSAVLEQLDSTGQLYLPGRLLSGDEVSDHPALVEAKLANGLAVAPRERIEPLRSAYEVAQSTASRSTGRTASVHLEPQAYAQGPLA